jgi:hypothetical protein
MTAQRCPLQHLLVPALIGLSLFLLATPFVTGSESPPAGSEARLRELLTERYDVLKQRLASMKIFMDNGRVDPADWRRAVVELHRAEAELCTTTADRVEVYEKLVAALQSQEDLAARREDAGRITRWQLAEARFATLQAKIDLERARLGRQAPW